jgi:hypothetical protein
MTRLSSDIEIEDDLKELYELTAKVARRCMYDLKHCIDELSEEKQAVYLPRFRNFETILEAASGTKDYRHRLHHEIWGLEFENDKLKKLLKKHGIDEPPEVPF